MNVVGIFIILIIITSGCIYQKDESNKKSEISLKCEPVVVVTDIDYTLDPDSVPYKEIHKVFEDNYSGKDLSIELRDVVIKCMVDKAKKLGENSTLLNASIKSTYYDAWDERPHEIPCYAEKCIYKNESIWAIAFNRANSFKEISLHHFDLYFVSISTIETILNTGNQSTIDLNPILYHTGCK